MSSEKTFKETESLCEKLINSKQFEQGQNLYTQWLEKFESSTQITLLAKAYNNRGHLKYLSVQFDEAILDYNSSLKHEISAIAFYNRGTIYYRMSNFEKAVEDFKCASSLNPEDNEFQLALERCNEQMTLKNKTS